MRQAHFFRALLAFFLCLCLCAGLLAGCSARTASSAPAPVSGAPQQAPAGPVSYTHLAAQGNHHGLHAAVGHKEAAERAAQSRNGHGQQHGPPDVEEMCIRDRA